jgi:hypothetical protein
LYPSCPDCQSAEVRPSKSSYPLDQEKLAASAGAFWRCGNCGTRFMGPAPPPVPERKYRPHRHATDPFKSAITGSGGMARFVVPLLLLTVTLLGVILVLLLRDPLPLVR